MGLHVTGQELADDIENLTITRKPLIEEFLYERDILMIPAQAGAGKSIIATQLAISLSSGSPLFGTLKIPEPKKVLYLQLEGDYEESIERMRFMKEKIAIDTDNLLWFEYKALDVADEASVKFFFQVIKDSGFKPDVFIVDPLYKLCAQDLASGSAAISVVKFSDKIYEEYGCTNVLIHHNHRDKYTTTGNKMNEQNAYYGHSFIQNHIRTSYELTNNKEQTEPTLRRKKGRGSDTFKEIKLSYDARTMTCWVQKNLTAIDKIVVYANLCRSQKITPDFNQICEGASISHVHLRRLAETPEFLEIWSVDKNHNRKHFYIPK